MAAHAVLRNMTKEELRKDYAHWLVVQARGSYLDYMAARNRAEEETMRRDYLLNLSEQLRQKAEELDPGIWQR